jgi:hypothetical protein
VKKSSDRPGCGSDAGIVACDMAMDLARAELRDKMNYRKSVM